MLDPLTALSLAGTIVQLVDFSYKIIRESKQFLEAGAFRENVELEMVTSDLVDLIARIKPSYTGLKRPSVLEENEKALVREGRTAVSIARELINELEKFKTGSRTSLGSSLTLSIRASLGSSKVASIEERLEKVRNRLQTHLLVSLRLSYDEQSLIQNKKLDDLDTQLKNVIGLIIRSDRGVFDELQNCDIVLRQRFDQTDDLIRQSHNDIISVISQLAASQGLHPRSQSNVVPMDLQCPLAERVENEVLSRLRFPGMYDRRREVEPAYKETFKWILSDSEHTNHTMSNLLNWLEYGEGCYWINGKAASGKSTLMRHIMERPEFDQALQAWAGTRYLVKCSFFFWHLGTRLQKSQEGIYRSILYEILSACPELIQGVMPGYYNDVYTAISMPKTSDYEFISTPLSVTELKLAFLRVIEQLTVTNAKLCILLDGVDEFDGDHADLAANFKSIASPGVKLLLSSRPINACKAAFGGFPGVRLQDLTRPDIAFYVSDKLESHDRAKTLKANDPDTWSRFLESIPEKAQGVFLWVILVVKSLRRGLDNCDSIAELQERLDDSPPELEDLYGRMLNRMEPLYRKQAARYFRIVMRSMDIQLDSPLTLLQMYFAGVDDKSIESMNKANTMDQTIIEAKCQETEARLTSRCCGLVECREVTSSATVTFLHKTVVEFLQSDSQWSETALKSLQPDFDADEALLVSSYAFVRVQLANLKGLPPDPDQDHARITRHVDSEYAWPKLRAAVEHVLKYARTSETKFSSWVLEMHNLLDSTFSSRSLSSAYPLHTWASVLCIAPKRKVRYLKEHSPSLALVQLGMLDVLSRGIALEPITPLRRKEPALLAETMDSIYCSQLRSLGSARLPSMVQILLESGADPNLRLSRSDMPSAWESAIRHFQELQVHSLVHEEVLLEYCSALIALAPKAKRGVIISFEEFIGTSKRTRRTSAETLIAELAEETTNTKIRTRLGQLEELIGTDVRESKMIHQTDLLKPIAPAKATRTSVSPSRFSFKTKLKDWQSNS